jgi:hypothetical protein
VRRALIVAVLFASPAQGQDPVRLTAAPIARIGCAVCAGAAEFANPQAVHLQPDTTILVIDLSAPHLRQFDLRGRELRAWGRSGRGPGELLLPLGAQIYADGSYDVPDLRLQHIVRYSPDGKPMSTRRLAAFPLALGRHMQRNELYLTTTDFMTPGFLIERWSRADSARSIFTRLDTLFPRALDGRPASVFPFAAAPDGRVALADGGQYHVRVLSRTASLHAEIKRELPRLRKTDREIQEERRALVRQRDRLARMRAAEGGGPPNRAFEPYPFRAHITRLDFDGAGRLWVQTGRGGPNQTVFDVFDFAGKQQAELILPVRVQAFDVEGNVLVASALDRDGAPLVTSWRLSGWSP